MVNMFHFDIFKGKHFKIEFHWLKLYKLTTDGLNPTTLVRLYLCFLSHVLFSVNIAHSFLEYERFFILKPI